MNRIEAGFGGRKNYGSVASGTVQTSKQCGRRALAPRGGGDGQGMVMEADKIVPTAKIGRIYGTMRGGLLFIPSGRGAPCSLDQEVFQTSCSISYCAILQKRDGKEKRC